jgi:asparaginyl-tRNA synthetase
MSTFSSVSSICADLIGQTVSLRGWIYASSSFGKMLFIQLRDGTGIIQCVCEKSVLGADLFKQLKSAGQETSLQLEGIVREDSRSKGGFEVVVGAAQIIGSSSDFPISPKEHGDAFLFDHRHLHLRSQKTFHSMKVRHLLEQAIRHYFDSRDYLLLDSPIFTPAACEGTSTLFETEYFGDKAYLSQSGQLYQEVGALAFGKTYCFGPTFRAEKSSTRRHLTEFWMVEPEIAFAQLSDIMDLTEDFLVEIVAFVLAKGRHHLEALGRDISVLERVQKPFPRMSYDEACEILKGIGQPVEPEDDFGSPHETELTKLYDRPILVHHYPSAVKAFYMKEDPAIKGRALGVDVLAPEGYGEIIGGGEREDRLDVLVSKIEEHGLPMEAFSWYLDLRRYGSVPHGGFGLGLERMVRWVCGLHHIRETVPFPRTIDRLTP